MRGATEYQALVDGLVFERVVLLVDAAASCNSLPYCGLLDFVHIAYRSNERRVMSRSRGLRLPEDLEEDIERESDLRGGASFSELAISLLREAVRMRRVPGIYFVDGLDSRRAAVTGTGIEVWEVVRAYRSAGEDFGQLEESYPWLSRAQLTAALSYYELYPREIDARIEQDERWTPERAYAEFPFMRPGVSGKERAIGGRE